MLALRYDKIYCIILKILSFVFIALIAFFYYCFSIVVAVTCCNATFYDVSFLFASLSVPALILLLFALGTHFTFVARQVW